MKAIFIIVICFAMARIIESLYKALFEADEVKDSFSKGIMFVTYVIIAAIYFLAGIVAANQIYLINNPL